MLAAIDVGNTNILVGLHSGNQWVHHWRVQTDPNKMPDEYHLLFTGLLSEAGRSGADLSRCIVSSVVPELTGTISGTFRRISGTTPLIAGVDLNSPVAVRSENPREVGADLLANAVAAFTRYRGRCIIVDFGTALTFTAVSDTGEFLGAAIAPGLRTAASALSRSTAQLPHIELVAPPKAVGTNTVQALQSGIVYGFAGLVEGVVRRMTYELGGGEVPVIATGGLAATMDQLLPLVTETDPWLTLEGLRILADLNRA
jgi:type III pantothenate kinase